MLDPRMPYDIPRPHYAEFISEVYEGLTRRERMVIDALLFRPDWSFTPIQKKFLDRMAIKYGWLVFLLHSRNGICTPTQCWWTCKWRRE